MSEREIRTRLESIGIGMSRYGLVVVLTLIGLLKFTSAEVQRVPHNLAKTYTPTTFGIGSY